MMDNPTAQQRGLHLACVQVNYVSKDFWEALLKYLRSRIRQVKLSTEKRARKVNITSYPDVKDLLANKLKTDTKIVLLCGYAPSIRIEPRAWRESLALLPAYMQHINIVLCFDSMTVQSGEGRNALDFISFGVGRSVINDKWAVKNIEKIKKALAQQAL